MLEEARGSEVLRKAHPLPCTSTSILLGGDDKRTKAHVPGTNNVATMRTFIDLLPGFDKRAPNAFRTRAVGNTPFCMAEFVSISTGRSCMKNRNLA